MDLIDTRFIKNERVVNMCAARNNAIEPLTTSLSTTLVVEEIIADAIKKFRSVAPSIVTVLCSTFRVGSVLDPDLFFAGFDHPKQPTESSSHQTVRLYRGI